MSAMLKTRMHRSRVVLREAALDTTSLPLFNWSAHYPGKPSSASSPPPARHCKSCGTQISRYSRGHCRSCGYIGLKRDCPGDFLAVLKNLGSQGAAKHFSASLSTVTRWRHEEGLALHMRAKHGVVGGNPSFRVAMGRIAPRNRDMSMAGQAADFLRQFGSVYRCNERGKPDAKGTHWRRNLSVLSDDEMIARAARLGWVEV